MASGSGDVVKFGVRAFSKMIMHCLKYPQNSVNGVLLADEKRRAGDPSQLHIVDSMPLFHQCLGLTPMLEVALVQIDQHCKNAGLVIAGYYQANEHLRDSAPDLIALRVADKVAENFADACLVMIDNQQVSLDCDRAPVVVYGSQDGRWRERTFALADKSLGVTASLLRAKTYRALTDFDNHLDDIRRDWSNREINEEIARCL
uniref:MPN domain-containing protein n=1 Tax=Amblyomma parvum TaxID=251391 RepID=A0A023FX82_AMBPA